MSAQGAQGWRDAAMGGSQVHRVGATNWPLNSPKGPTLLQESATQPPWLHPWAPASARSSAPPSQTPGRDAAALQGPCARQCCRDARQPLPPSRPRPPGRGVGGPRLAQRSRGSDTVWPVPGLPGPWLCGPISVSVLCPCPFVHASRVSPESLQRPLGQASCHLWAIVLRPPHADFHVLPAGASHPQTSFVQSCPVLLAPPLAWIMSACPLTPVPPPIRLHSHSAQEPLILLQPRGSKRQPGKPLPCISFIKILQKFPLGHTPSP